MKSGGNLLVLSGALLVKRHERAAKTSSGKGEVKLTRTAQVCRFILHPSNFLIWAAHQWTKHRVRRFRLTSPSLLSREEACLLCLPPACWRTRWYTSVGRPRCDPTALWRHSHLCCGGMIFLQRKKLVLGVTFNSEQPDLDEQKFAFYPHFISSIFPFAYHWSALLFVF